MRVVAAASHAGLDYIVPVPSVTIPSLGSVSVPVIVTAPADRAPSGLRVELEASMDGLSSPPLEISAPFLTPHRDVERAAR